MSSPPYLHSRPISRYASPTPSQWSGDTYHSQWSGEAYPGQQPGIVGYSPYGQAMSLHSQPPQFGSPVLNSARQPSTPPTSSHSQDERVSNRNPQRRNPTKRKNKTNGAKLDVPELERPLSDLTKDMHDIPVKDMAIFVNRPIEERHQEAMNRKGNKIPRPMNSFMLYRSAYAERTKRWCSQNNHQVVSALSGKSWRMEPENIRAMYNDLARIERENHQQAYPEYKFSPSKTTTASTSRKRKEHSDDEDGFGTIDSDDDEVDPDYRPSGSTRRRARPDSVRSNQSGTPELGPYSPYMDFSNSAGHYPHINGRKPPLLPLPYYATDPTAVAPEQLVEQGYSGFYDLQEHPGPANLRDNVHEDHFARHAAHAYMQQVQQQPIVGLPENGCPGLIEGQSFSPGFFDPNQVDPNLMHDVNEMYFPGHEMIPNATAFSEQNFNELDQQMMASMEPAMGSTEGHQFWTSNPRHEGESDFEKML